MKGVEEALRKIEEKDPIIATYGANDLVERPDIVENTYSMHAETHISIGDTSRYLDNLINWIVKNKGCVTGAIIGEYGYGKTSTAIYLWKKCQESEIIAIPPFEWYSLEDLIKGIYGWVRYKLRNAPTLLSELEVLHRECEKSTIEKIATEMKIGIEQLKKLRDDGRLRLELSPSEVLEFLSKITNIALKAKFKGVIVFTDELQGTLEAYPSPAKFYDDMFNLANGLFSREGNYGIIFCMPNSTELIIADVRRDIIHRLEGRNLYFRCEEMYGRDFPRTLWEKYAYKYEFKESKFDIVTPETLDAIGQISSRKDLGAGPRSVIEAFVQVSEHYLETQQAYTPINLIDDHLSKKISFATGSKLVQVVTEQLDAVLIKKNEEKAHTIKLLAAFPQYGCPKEIIQRYGFEAVLDELIKELYGTVIQELPEGHTLLKLREEQLIVERAHERLIREFIRRYVDDSTHAQMALKAFVNYIITEVFSKPTKGTIPIEAWKTEAESPIENGVQLDLKGSFDPKYPFRELLLTVTTQEPNTSIGVAGIGLCFYLDYGKDRTDTGEIRCISENKALFRLNLLRSLEKELQIPHKELISKEKMSPMFMLSMLWYLDQNSSTIPNSEENQMMWIRDTLVNNSIEVLLGTNLKDCNDFELENFGKQAIKTVFSDMCDRLYPQYKTLINTPSPFWQKSLNPYIQALKDERVPLSAKRGKKWFEAKKDIIANIFGISSVLTVQTTMNALSDLIEYDWGSKDEPIAKILFKMYPLEEAILEHLHKSEKTLKRDENYVHILSKETVSDKSFQLGYTEEEIEICINLLELRKYIIFNTEEGYLEEAIGSPAEFQEALTELAKKTRDALETLDVIGGIFGKETYESKIKGFERRIDGIKEVEEYEELEKEISDLLFQLKGSISNTKGEVQSDLNTIFSKISAITTQGAPHELAKDKEAGVSWVSDFNKCRIILSDNYTKIINNLKRDNAEIKDLQKKFLSVREEKSFQTIYTEYITLKEEIEGYFKELGSAQLDLGNYSRWINVLDKATTISQDANQLKKTYNNPDFSDKLEEYFKVIALDLKERRLDALADHEIHLKSIKDIETKMADWLRTRRGEFIKLKEKYESDLAELRVDKYKLRTNFDQFNPEGCLGDLFDEVKENMNEHLSEIENRAKAFRNQLLFASKILSRDVEELLERVRDVMTELNIVQGDLLVDNVEDDKKWGLITEKTKEITMSLEGIDDSLKGIIEKKEATEEEKGILNMLADDPHGTDLNSLIMKLVEDEGDKFSLDGLMVRLQKLFQKNHLIIKILLRR
jgi:hypothetical protein